jgi:hypothetical protein
MDRENEREEKAFHGAGFTRVLAPEVAAGLAVEAGLPVEAGLGVAADLVLGAAGLVLGAAGLAPGVDAGFAEGFWDVLEEGLGVGVAVGFGGVLTNIFGDASARSAS